MIEPLQFRMEYHVLLDGVITTPDIIYMYLNKQHRT